MKATLLALALVGCASPVTSYTVAFTPGVDDAQAEVATAAALEWQARVPALTFRFERAAYDVNAQDTMWITSDATVTQMAVTTWGTGAPGSAYTRVRVWTKDTVAHELGHAMGLEHSSCGVMQKRVNPYRDDGVQTCDAEWLRASWGEP